jgi:transposase-like protein
MRKFMAIDGTFLKARFIQTLLLAVGIDANGHNLLLAWAVVESENTNSWSWFLNHLKRAIPQCLQMTLISDRDKGLLAADVVLGPGVDRLVCCFHLKCNFVKRYRGVENYFWPIANAKSQEEFTEKMDQL